MPNDLVIGNGTDAKFTAVATGISTNKNNFVYQWRKRDSNNLPDKVTDANETVLIIPNVTESDEGQYYCIVTNEWGTSVESNEVTLSIFGMLMLIYSKISFFLYIVIDCYFVGHPRIFDHPENAEIPIGESITLMCNGSGIGTLVYSWETNIDGNWTTASNDNTTSYTTDTTLAIGQYMYRCRMNNEAGSVVSNIATVNVYGEYYFQ